MAIVLITSALVTLSAHVPSKQIKMRYLLNSWWSKDEPAHATYRFQTRGVWDVEQAMGNDYFAYQVYGDSLIIKYPGRKARFKIQLLTPDSLVLSNEYGSSTYTTKRN
ncbi:MAG: hypothetical protein JWO03_278 [Bacteroidetes bacterium]|nr:hypothetical protein [Bacteroidota bacterium]